MQTRDRRQMLLNDAERKLAQTRYRTSRAKQFSPANELQSGDANTSKDRTEGCLRLGTTVVRWRH